MILTIWTKDDLMQVCQLSDDPADGTPTEQIAQIGNAGFAGWTCVDENYTGTFPETDSSLWYWDGSGVSVKPELPEQTVARLERALDAYIDSQAYAYRYESIRTMVTYENDPNPKFNAEGKGAKAFRSACYTLSIQIVGEVPQGLRPIPTEEELIALMPTLSSFIVYD